MLQTCRAVDEGEAQWIAQRWDDARTALNEEDDARHTRNSGDGAVA